MVDRFNLKESKVPCFTVLFSLWWTFTLNSVSIKVNIRCFL